MTNACEICGKESEDESGYHPACLRRLFGTPSLPIIELTHGEVLARAQEMAGRMSISGVQPKLSMSRQGSRLVPVTDGGQFILKPQTERFPLLPQNENLCMTIAERMEIDVPPHGLFNLRDDSPAYIVRRFDRTPDGQKLRCEDFLQILGEDDKYAGSVERIGKKIRELSSVPGLDAQLFFERVLLNFLLGDGDAHLKNFSLLETKDGGLRLSPAHDIVCSKAVIPKETDFDLRREFPTMTGLSALNLWRMRAFYLAYAASNQKLSQPVTEPDSQRLRIEASRFRNCRKARARFVAYV